MSSPLFYFKNVSCTINGKTLLSGLSFQIHEKDCLAVIGPSGSGKSSLLKLMNGLQSASDGEIQFKGRDLESYDIRDLRQNVGMVFQQPVMVKGTVKENLTLVNRWNRDFNPTDSTLIGALKDVGLSEDFLFQDARVLSGGEKQRVSIARTLLNKPEVILLDEPTTGMDPQLARRIIELIFRLKSTFEFSIVMVTHHPHWIENRSDKIIFMNQGSIEEFGGPELFKNPSEGIVKEYLQARGDTSTDV